MFIFHASDYPTRSDLETAVRNKFGLTTDKKDAQIHGTKEDLKRLSLEQDSVFWGIYSVETDSPNGLAEPKSSVLGGATAKPTKRQSLPTKKKAKAAKKVIKSVKKKK